MMLTIDFCESFEEFLKILLETWTNEHFCHFVQAIVTEEKYPFTEQDTGR